MRDPQGRGPTQEQGHMQWPPPQGEDSEELLGCDGEVGQAYKERKYFWLAILLYNLFFNPHINPTVYITISSKVEYSSACLCFQI